MQFNVRKMVQTLTHLYYLFGGIAVVEISCQLSEFMLVFNATCDHVAEVSCISLLLSTAKCHCRETHWRCTEQDMSARPSPHLAG